MVIHEGNIRFSYRYDSTTVLCFMWQRVACSAILSDGCAFFHYTGGAASVLIVPQGGPVDREGAVLGSCPFAQQGVFLSSSRGDARAYRPDLPTRIV